MKNKLLSYLLSLVFIIQGITLIGQTELDQFYLGLRIGPPSYNLPFLSISGSDNFISIRKKSDFKFSFNITEEWNPSGDSYLIIDNYYYNSGWRGRISNLTLGYSPISHLFGTANFILADEKFGLYDSQMILGDIGIGGYMLKEGSGVDKKTSKWGMTDRGLLINALVGYSRGKISHVRISGVSVGEFTLNQFYGKIGLDYQTKFWGVASNLRFGVLNYGPTKLVGHAYENLVVQRKLLATQNNFLVGELSCRIYLGVKYGQLYINGVTTKVNDDLRAFVLSDLVSVGAVLDIQEIFKKKNKDDD